MISHLQIHFNYRMEQSLLTFENVGIGTTNTGLLLIGDEVIEYTSTTSSSVGGNITRGINNTLIDTYPIDTPVYKYELGGS